MRLVYPKQNLLFILIAPSGGGKTTVKERALAQCENMTYSVSCTTRPPRVGETDGVDYRFVSEPEFREMIARSEFLEYAEVHGHLYGTSRRFIERTLAAGQHVLLDIDVQGALNLESAGLPTISVFLVPPTLAELERRLRARGTDCPETIALRLHNARTEIEQAGNFDYLIVNDELEECVGDFLSIVRAEENRTSRYLSFKEIFYGGTNAE